MLQDFESVSYHFGILCIIGLRVEVDVGQNHSRHSGKKELALPAAEMYLEHIEYMKLNIYDGTFLQQYFNG